ncbi:glucose-1-phosphate thymidylyltransferase [Citrobacter phage Tr1]|nr:glucose-1-phosphate thymidylyltransferase [Citrobacter phage Tr1]
MKGIILAGGSGTRLHPVTKGVSKQLLPVYDKPMIYYPLSVLMLADIKDILIITTDEDQDSFKSLLGNGGQFGINLTYETQSYPNGLAEAFIIGEEFIGDDSVALVLGDNLFFGQSFGSLLHNAKEHVEHYGGAGIFGYHVNDPERFGVVEFDGDGRVVSIEEKPTNPRSNYAITGLYFYDNSVVGKAKSVRPSARGELEITDINEMYWRERNLQVHKLGRGFTWLDTGTHESLMEASNFIHTVEKQQGMKVACLEEIAFRKGWVGHATLLWYGTEMKKTEYGQYLLKLLEDSQCK